MKKIVIASAMFCLTFILCSFTAHWKTFASRAGRFKIDFPQEPKLTEKKLPAGTEDLSMSAFMCDLSNTNSDNKVYGVMYTDYPANTVNSSSDKKTLDLFFKGAAENSAKTVNGTLIANQKITLKGYPAIHIKILFGQDYIMDMKIALVGSRSYVVQVGYPKSKENNPLISRFFNSFDLVTGK